VLRCGVATSEATPEPLGGHVVGENLRRIRESRGLTQAEAADRLQATGLWWQRSHVAAIEAGNRESVDFGALALIAAAFDLPVSDLFVGDGPVRLSSDAVVTRQWLRDVFSHRPPSDAYEPSGRAARKFAEQIPGEKVSFQADAELAQRLGLRPEDVYQAAESLWQGRNLHQERDRRIAEMGEMSAAERRVRRGHVTRQLAKELAPYLPDPGGEAER
jgi:transcriptional regulator with XRE-family HTH domain